MVEFGCGTGPLLRAICERGFSGTGVDISERAVKMAREQSSGLDIEYLQGDVCGPVARRLGKFELAIDGLCLHCITEVGDRKRFLDSAYEVLVEGGLFVVLSMCGPVDRKLLEETHKGHKVLGKEVYVPFERWGFGGCREIGGKNYLPTRYMGHWREILKEVRGAGFEVRLMRYSAKNEKCGNGTLMLGAVKVC